VIFIKLFNFATKYVYNNVFMKKYRLIQLTMAFMLSSIGVQAQQSNQFSVATVNVDGLPTKILFFNVNADGLGDHGSSRLGKYLMQKNYDIVCMQEDFNYHGVWAPWVEDTYKIDTWSGAVGLDVPGKKIDFLHAQNEKFECDGLGAIWKNNVMMTSVERVMWTASFGKFSHAADALVTKGFRRYEMTLANGTQLLVYNMHMDAGSLVDEKEGKDSLDLAARQSQWQQLKDDVLARLDNRPVIIMGDMNSYYSRDHIKAKFIDAIAASGKGVASDVWVELDKKGNYPAPVDTIVYCDSPDNILNGEALDKIIYINPTSGTQIKPISFSIDKEGYLYNGKPLGDHYPVTATFEIVSANAAKGVTAIEQPTATSTSSATYYNINGQHVDKPAKGLVIEQNGQGTHKRIIK